jgi:Domain of unknown function (DUF1990)
MRSPAEGERSDRPPWVGRARNLGAELGRLAELEPNFEPGELPRVERDAWHVDDYCHPLPPEPAGEPVANGSFEAAVGLLRDYEFADPRRVRAYYRANAPLLHRDMLLEIRFAGLRVRVGVRISQIFDELRSANDRPVRISGWAYRTLEGHLERGQMDYQVWKWLDTGEVEYRIHAVSELGEVRSAWLALGFRLVGRREQVRFARRCGERMERLVRLVLARGCSVEPRPAAAGAIVVSPSPD